MLRPGAVLGKPVQDDVQRNEDHGLDQPDAAMDFPRGRAAALVERLTVLGEKAVDLAVENRRLRADLATKATRPDAVWFDDPRDWHPWPFLADPLQPPTGFYDHRADDDLIRCAADGAAFLGEFGLLGDAPRFAAAIAALNGTARVLRTPGDDQAPDVSIVIPVHGQLAYTLNCLAGLFAQQAAASAEIIVVDDASPDGSFRLLSRVKGIKVMRRRVNAGFIASCTAGAAKARGGVIVMLNNDTRVLPGWLDGLLASFKDFPRAGLVGSKLLYPDGTLQECGGIVWRDGRAWNYGRDDDPNRPQYNFAREVDFVSGASIAVPSKLWRELGGFDRHFAPAYYEDVDLAFRLRARGYQTWVQPRSRLIHYEGKTSGTDISHGAKAYQVINAHKFFLRWRETLLAHRRGGEAPFFERERSVRQRALVIDASCPTPKQDAGSGYVISTFRLFQALGYKVVFLPQDNLLFQPAHTPELERIGVECVHVPYHASVEAYLRLYGWLFDVVLVFRPQVLAAVIAPLRAHAPDAPILFDTVDLHYLRAQRAAEISGPIVDQDAIDAMRAEELGVIGRADCILTPSTHEADILRHELPALSVAVLPLMVEPHGTGIGFSKRRDICFLGGYTHAPNADAVIFFVTEILPLIHADDASIRFIVVGANPTPEVRALASATVVVTGMIDDLREVFDGIRVFVCPLRFGAGTKGKIVMAMSYGVPVVSTTIGSEGMQLVDGAHLLIADTPAEIAQACLRAYTDTTLWTQLSKAGLRQVRDVWSLKRGRRVLRDSIAAAHRHLRGRPSDLSSAA